ncbi:hypothetical protein CJO82_22180 (plasmid) [Ralstonia solanacearum]|nr:hypothetical protein CJO82_22180 [Ralstonia solanacearum]AXW21642.1 hypothetical protein CJO85_22250 [Ralstonia solanacearum]AXW26301.1 hypothetical protein CJO86_22445 [Ralstonia solanacearum]AXW83214.1 hypothetical protein CJO98_22540 [Ralstonia solanacearum]
MAHGPVTPCEAECGARTSLEAGLAGPYDGAVAGHLAMTRIRSPRARKAQRSAMGGGRVQ